MFLINRDDISIISQRALGSPLFHLYFHLFILVVFLNDVSKNPSRDFKKIVS